jgi:hypothetical protein
MSEAGLSALEAEQSCNLSEWSFTAAGTAQFCGDSPGNYSEWRLFSGSPGHSIRIVDAEIAIVVDGVKLSTNGTAPF